MESTFKNTLKQRNNGKEGFCLGRNPSKLLMTNSEDIQKPPIPQSPNNHPQLCELKLPVVDPAAVKLPKLRTMSRNETSILNPS